MSEEKLLIQEHNRQIRGVPGGQTIEVHVDDNTSTVLCKFSDSDTKVVGEYVSSCLPSHITDENKDEYFDTFVHCFGDPEAEDPSYESEEPEDVDSAYESGSESEGEIPGAEDSSDESESEGEPHVPETVVPSQSVSDGEHIASVVTDSSSTFSEESLEKTFEAMCNLCELFV